MNICSFFTGICCIISFVNTYVLFAANLEDFRSIAKKFVPAELADQIADIAVRSSVKTSDDYAIKTHDDSKLTERGRFEDKDPPNYSGSTQKKTRYSITNQEPINIDDIVEKVKQKLEKDFHNKYVSNLTALQEMIKKHSSIKKQSNDEPIDYSQDHKPKFESYRPKIGARIPNKHIKDKQRENFEEKKPIYVDDTKTFSKTNLAKTKDSYEDYVFPEKDDVSQENSNRKNQDATYKEYNKNQGNSYKDYDKNQGKSYKDYDKNEAKTYKDYDKNQAKSYKDYDDKNPKQFDNVKAQTENLFYEDLASENTKKPLFNTMIPTKRVFRFSSPNYYAKLPTMVDKYDFNEPLPERDRERENIKHIPNPPANINGRQRLKI